MGRATLDHCLGHLRLLRSWKTEASVNFVPNRKLPKCHANWCRLLYNFGLIALP